MYLLFCLTGGALGTNLLINHHGKPTLPASLLSREKIAPTFWFCCAVVFLSKITCVLLANVPYFGLAIRMALINKYPIHVSLTGRFLCDFPINIKLIYCPSMSLLTISSSHCLHKGSKLGRTIPTPSNFIKNLDSFTVLFHPFWLLCGVQRDLLL